MLFWVIDTTPIMIFCKSSITNFLIFRGIGCLLTAFFISLVIGSYFISWLHNLQFFQIIRVEGPIMHQLKQGTPTMGGIIMLVSLIISIVIWVDLSNLYVWYVLFTLLSYGLLGFVDDLLKIKRRNTIGLSVLNKYFWQSLIALVLIVFVFFIRSNCMNIDVKGWEFFKNVILRFDFLSFLLAYFIIVGSSNAVNLSDGLDGLAIIPMILIAIGFMLVTLVVSNEYLSNYLHVTCIHYARELIIICSAIIGIGLGFLWFNSYPAQVFMGDTGSLSLGGVIGVISVLLQQEYLLLIMGGIFVVELLSVIFQVSFFKIFKKRIFNMTPIHHHFELKGYAEPKVVVRFWIISSVLMLCGLFIFVFK